MKTVTFISALSFLILTGCSSEKKESKEISELEYKGEKKDGKKHGLGMLIYSDGTPQVIGSFRNDSLNGIAKLTAKLGNFYLGEWKDHKWNGVGNAEWNSGEYAGDNCICTFENAELNGFARYHKKGQYIFTGFYENGKATKLGLIEFTDDPEYSGDIYYGELSDKGMHGKGFYVDASENMASYVHCENGDIVSMDSTIKPYVDSLKNVIEQEYEALETKFSAIEKEFEEIEKKINSKYK